MNPKWTKWAHRVFLAPLIGGFGRSCLIPNLSYLSEAAASLLDRRLETFIVPRTEVVSISSPTFFYSWLDLRKPKLPAKPGSFQLFCQGFQDASAFFKKHPWPGLPIPDDTSSLHRKRSRRFSLYRLLCGHRGNLSDTDSDDEDTPFLDAHHPDHASELRYGSLRDHPKDWAWSVELMDDFRLEMEKLVILDYLMRNTDRGLDNFMIRVCNASSCSDRQHRNLSHSMPPTSILSQSFHSNPHHAAGDYRARPHCHVAAIDNSLAFPHHHPNGWRNYAYGWLFLPASLIGQPFSRSTREHFLPLLTSPTWWAETVHELRKLFGTDPDFNVRMFERQMAVIKGQAWNIVESLKHEEEGPLELCRRQKALVWDEPVQLIWNELEGPIDIGTANSADEYDERATGEELQSTSAPAYPSYLPAAPMIIPPKKRPVIGRGWSLLGSGGPKIPPRPIGVASHHLTLDGARGLDVMKQLDALEAWHPESEIEVSSYRSPQRAHFRRSPHSQTNHSTSNLAHHAQELRQAGHSKPMESGRLKDLDHQKVKDAIGSFASRRSKSDGHITAPIMILGAGVNEVVNSNQRTDDGHQTGQGSVVGDDGPNQRTQAIQPPTLALAPRPNDGDRRLDRASQDTIIRRAHVTDDDVNDNEDEDGDGDDEDENDDDNSIQIGVVEKLEFVIAQPFFKNC